MTFQILWARITSVTLMKQVILDYGMERGAVQPRAVITIIHPGSTFHFLRHFRVIYKCAYAQMKTSIMKLLV